VRIPGLLFGLMILASPSLGAEEALTVMAPTVMLAPGHLVIQTGVEPDSENRGIRVVAESPAFYRSSEIQLSGATAPRRNTFEFKDLPNGTYEIRATLLGSDGQARALVVRKLEVVSHVRY
jgi:hypothetical protein